MHVISLYIQPGYAYAQAQDFINTRHGMIGAPGNKKIDRKFLQNYFFSASQ